MQPVPKSAFFSVSFYINILKYSLKSIDFCTYICYHITRKGENRMKKDSRIEIRISGEEKKELEAEAKKNNTNVSKLMRTIILSEINKYAMEMKDESENPLPIVCSEKVLTTSMKLFNNLTSKEAKEVLAAVKSGENVNVNKGFDVQYRIATKEDVRLSDEQDRIEYDEIAKQ